MDRKVSMMDGCLERGLVQEKNTDKNMRGEEIFAFYLLTVKKTL